MVLINIESLSLNELRYIAKQESLEDWESLGREELIEELEYLYDDEPTPETHSGSSKKKFVNTLTDVQPPDVLSLPGVEKLPDAYNETSIHLVMKDYNWAYVFWSLSAHEREELEANGCTLILRTHRINEQGEERAVYDIDVSITDNNWTVELPHLGYEYKASLVAICQGTESVICESSSIFTTKSYLMAHPDELKDDATFRRMFSSLVRKGGTVSSNRQIQNLVELLETGEHEEEAKA